MDANNSHSRIYFQVVFMIYNDVEYKHSLVVARLKSYIRLDYSTGTKKSQYHFTFVPLFMLLFARLQDDALLSNVSSLQY
mmetsp:Transcript_11323/g.24038  ORF Transcript_11323/g.24038 Transcript_11323/m.24038 type:complete len:80 (-) Transcript_11323:2130-2369(-)